MKLRYLLSIVIILTWITSCSTKDNKFTVVGEIANAPKQKVFLEEIKINEIVIVDSTTIGDKGKFELSGTALEPGLYRIRFDQRQFLLLSIDKGTVKVTGDWQNLDAYTVSGSPSSASLRQFLITVREHLRDFNTMTVVLDSLQARGSDSVLNVASVDLQNMKMDFTRYIEQYSDTTKYLPNALFAVQMLNPGVEKEYLQIFSQSLNSRFPNSQLAVDFADKLNQMFEVKTQPAGGVQVGASAPEFKSKTPQGNELALSSLKGKYVLIDFWASWCGPCRGENPKVVAAYNKFKDKNFTILGVSLDTDKEKWEKAIEKDNLTWTHVSDLQGWESVAARIYKVESIPTNFLLDPDGKVIARDLRGSGLDAKLAEVLQ